MGKSGSKAQAETKGWQVKSERFKDYVSRLDQLAEYTDSTSDEAVIKRMDIDVRDKKGGAKVKELVSKNKIRFRNRFFNLDLAYVTDRIVAMGFPAIGFQRLYRNSRDDVISFLDTYHPTHYKLYNLCAEADRFYNNKEFPGVRVELFPIIDHQATSLLMLFLFCLDAYYYLRESTSNIIVVHCKAGKGRTGMMISSLLLFTGLKKSPEEALVYYGKRRALDGVGVSIPSQIRSVEYFDAFLLEEFGEQYRSSMDFLLSNQEAIARKIKMRNSKPFSILSLRVYSLQASLPSRAIVKVKMLEKSQEQTVEFLPQTLEQDVCDLLPASEVVVTGDFCIILRTKELSFRIWMNAYFSEPDEILESLFPGVEGSLYSSVFCFKRERAPLAPPHEWPRKSLSDFDMRGGSLAKQADLKLKVVYSGSKFKTGARISTE
jgi:protein-tyrosine phosphatase/RNA-binding protein YhbY